MNVIPTDTTTLVSYLTSLILPAALAFIQAREKSNKFATGFSFLACMLVAAIQVYLTKRWAGGEPTTTDGWVRLIISNVILVTVMAQVAYLGYKKAGLIDALERVGPALGYRTRHARTIIDTSRPTSAPPVATSARARDHV